MPEVLAVQFDSAGNPTNSMRKWVILAIETAVLLFVLLKYSLRLWETERERPTSDIIIYYVAVILMTVVFQIILRFNLNS